jgi:hypothetical protein
LGAAFDPDAHAGIPAAQVFGGGGVILAASEQKYRGQRGDKPASEIGKSAFLHYHGYKILAPVWGAQRV